MRQYAKIQDHVGLVRDMGTQAVLQTDLAVVRRHEKRTAELAKEEARTAEINNLKTELAELRDMLKVLTGK